MTKARTALIRLTLVLCMGWVPPVFGQNEGMVTLQLLNGDQLTGEVVSEDEDQVVIKTTWESTIAIPKKQIELRLPQVLPQDSQGQTATNPPPLTAQTTTPTNAPAPAETKVEKPAQPKTVAKAPKYWKWDLKLGTDLVQGAKDRQIYFGQTSLTYSRNYESNAKKFLRNKTEYRVDYGETDGDVSANRMVGANKLDFDIFSSYYGYGAMGAGYDTVRKIEYQVEIGPGLGYHLVAKKSVALDVELGVNYQYREGLDTAPNRELFQGRVGQELTWEVVPKITLTEAVAFLPFLNDFGQYQVRFEGNLGFGIVRHLSLNLTVQNLYDTLPAPGVPNNEFQFRSSLGVNF